MTMANQQPIERDPIPESFASLTEAAEFWDTHSTADYEDLLEDVTFEVNLTGKSTFSKLTRSIDKKWSRP